VWLLQRYEVTLALFVSVIDAYFTRSFNIADSSVVPGTPIYRHMLGSNAVEIAFRQQQCGSLGYHHLKCSFPQIPAVFYTL
jgi:hypothetical protein